MIQLKLFSQATIPIAAKKHSMEEHHEDLEGCKLIENHNNDSANRYYLWSLKCKNYFSNLATMNKEQIKLERTSNNKFHIHKCD